MKTRIPIIVSFFVPVLLIFMISCKNTEQRAFDSLVALVEDVEANGDSYSNADWKSSIQSFKDLTELLDTQSEQFTPEQKREIGRLKARYHKKMISHALRTFGNYMSDKSYEMEGYLDEFAADTTGINSLGSNGMDVDEWINEMNKSIDELSDIINR